MTAAEFRDAMAPLGAVAWKYGKGLTKPTMALFWSAFREVDAAPFARAVARHIAGSSEFPTPHDLRMALGWNGLPSLADAGAAFDALLGRAPHMDPRLGDYWTPEDVFEAHGAAGLAAFMGAGGPRAFRDRLERDVPFLRRDFLKAWTEAVERIRVEGPRVLPPAARAPRGLAPAAESLVRILPADFKEAAAGDEPGDAYEEPAQ